VYSGKIIPVKVHFGKPKSNSKVVEIVMGMNTF